VNIEEAKQLLNQAFENLKKVQEELTVEFSEELAPDTTQEKFTEQLERAMTAIENCDYDLTQAEDLNLQQLDEILQGFE
jgi:exonuclease VII small subunit